MSLVKRVPCSGSVTQNRLVEITTVSSKRVATAMATAGGTRNQIGVLLDDNISSGDLASVQFSGVCRVVAGGTITAGSKVTCDNAGRVVAATTQDHYILGEVIGRVSVTDSTQLLGAAASGDLVEVYLFDNKLSQVPA
jgi:hypothetical protein